MIVVGLRMPSIGAAALCGERGGLIPVRTLPPQTAAGELPRQRCRSMVPPMLLHDRSLHFHVNSFTIARMFTR
ncbi:hypothetical protein EYC54_06705 [Xanthomonas oryzae]|nr:hypothetical protein EYC54_06705 [Xanthomonas oryzae]